MSSHTQNYCNYLNKNFPDSGEWRYVPELRCYASFNGDVASDYRSKPYKLIENYNGYLVVNIIGFNTVKQHRVNKVICLAFYGKRPTTEHQSAHKDGNRKNNRADNLYWALPQENSNDLVKSGKLNGINSKLTREDVIKIRQRYKNGERVTKIAESYNKVCVATVSHAALGRSWKHVPN